MAEIYGFKINVDGNAIKSIEAIDQKLNGITKTAQNSDSVFKGLFKFETLKQGFELLKTGAQYVYDVGKNMEQTRLGFDVMLGGAEAGQKMTAELKKLADTTPMVDSTIYDSGRMLLSYGVNANEVSENIRMLGDVSSGNTERFQRLVYAYSQISSAGRLQGQDLRQLVEAGFNPLQIISEKTGESMLSLKEKMAKGEISFAMVKQAFKDATSEGGKFYNMMERQSQTVGGLQSTFQGAMETLGIGLFDRMSPAMKSILKDATDVANAIAKWVTPKESEKLSEARIEMNAMFDVLKKSNVPLDIRKKLIGDLNTQYGSYLDGLITEKTTTAELAKMQIKSNSAMLDKIRITAQNEVLSEYYEKIGDIQKDIMQTEIEYAKVKGTKAKKVIGFGDEATTMSAEEYYKEELNVFYKRLKEAEAELNKFSNIISKSNEMPETLATKEPTENNIIAKGFDANKYITGVTKPKNSIELVTPNSELQSKIAKEGLDAVINPIKKKLEEDLQKSKNKFGLKSSSIVTDGTNINDPFLGGAEGTAELGAKGGLGTAKVINITFNKELLSIKTDNIDGEGLKDNSIKAIEEVIRIVNNMSSGGGEM